MSAPKRAKKASVPAGHWRRLASRFKAARRYYIWKDNLKRWQRRLLNTAYIIIAIVAVHNLVEASWRPVQHPNYGVSFSIKYSQELGLNWQNNFLALLDDLKFRNFRLMSYWDMYEPQRNVYDFSSLDWQMDQVAKRGGKVSLAIGYRQPRWPECHQPDWARELGYGSRAWQNQLDNYIQTVMERYRRHPALQSYQLENESVNNWFGECPGAAPADRLIEEYNLAKKTDPAHPVMMSLSDEHGYPVHQPSPDAYGFSVYRTVWNDKTPVNFYMTYPTPIWYHRLRKLIIEAYTGKPVFIHELQVEPWGPQPTRDLSIKEQNKSMSVHQIHKNFDFGRKIGAKDIYTWGGEWWYWRKTAFNDPGPWEAVRAELSK